VAAFSQVLPPPTLGISGPANVLVDPVIAAYSSYFAPRTPTNLVNSSGLTAGPSGVLGAADSTHDTNADLSMWYSNPYITPPDTNPFVTFYLGGAYTLQTTRLWQYNQPDGFTVYGAKDIDVLVSADGTNFNLLSTISAARAGGTNGEPAQDFRTPATDVQYITLHIADTFGGATASGLSEVRFVASNAGVTLTLGGVVGQHYQVQSRDSLNGTDSWQLVQDLPCLSHSPALVSVAPPYQSQRFYRALLVPPSSAMLNAKTDFNAAGDGVTDDTAAITNWIAAVISRGPTGFLPAGTYKCTSPLVFLLNSAPTTGCTFTGDGVGRSIIDVTSVPVSPQVLLSTTSSATGSDYFKMTDIGLYGNTTGVVCQVGSETFSDPVNEPVLDLLVLNFNTADTAQAVELNFVLNGNLRLIADVGGDGKGLTMNQCCFNTLQGSYSAILGTGIHLTDGFNYGNVFLSPDLENVTNCVVIDGANCVNNTFIGGTWSYTGAGIVATAGGANRIVNPNPNPPSPGTLAGFMGSTVGVLIESPLFAVSTPAVAASGASVTNTTGQRVQVLIWGGTVSSIIANGLGIGVSGGTFIVNPGESLGVNYSSKPTWHWTAIP